MKLNTKILVLDDEPLIRLVVCSKLENCGALVSEAGTCAEALELARNTDFDAAVFDHRLPDGGGLDLVRLLRRQGFGFPVVMLSGEAVDLAAAAKEEDGISEIFSKPPDLEAVAEAVARAVGSPPCVKSTRVGRFAFFKAGEMATGVPGAWAEAEWLAVDFSEEEDPEPRPCVVDCICLPRRGVVAVGANAALRRGLEALDVRIEFVASADELAALSRHPSTPLERASLLGVAIHRSMS